MTALERQTRDDFIAWVDKYLTAHEEQPYQYRGLDVYGARTAVLHAFGSEADFHEKNPAAKIFAYHDGVKHVFKPEENEKLVIIGTASFLNDIIHAIGAFTEDCKKDDALRARVARRLPRVLATLPYPKT